MKKFTYMILIVVGLFVFLAISRPGIAASESGTVTGAARTTFSSAASFNSVALSGFDVGTGILIEADGSATGSFSAVLLGHSLLGQPQQIVIDGKALEGAIAPDGRAYVNGVATVDPGNGLPSLQGIPFRMTTAANGVLLTIGSTALPVAQVTTGTISVE